MCVHVCAHVHMSMVTIKRQKLKISLLKLLIKLYGSIFKFLNFQKIIKTICSYRYQNEFFLEYHKQSGYSTLFILN